MADSIALTLPSLALGGAERVAAQLANHWCRQGHLVSLITLDDVASDSYWLDPGVRRIGLNLTCDSQSLWQSVTRNLNRVHQLRRALQSVDPQAIVSFIDTMNVLTLLASQWMPARRVVSERTNPAAPRLSRSWLWLRHRLYHQASTVVVQTAGAATYFRDIVEASRLAVIPNAAWETLVDTSEVAPAVVEGPFVLAVGRLSREKGFDLLIQAFAEIAAEYPEWKLAILGEGPERERLQRTADKAHLNGRLHMPGWIADPAAWFSSAELFVLPSRFEGFPNALLESMAAGRAVIAADCPHGPGEIVRHERDGLLVQPDDASALAVAIEQLINDPQKRTRLGVAARKVVKRFSVTDFFQSWDRVITGCG